MSVGPGTTVDEAVAAVIAAVEAEEGKLAPKKRAVLEAALGCFAEQGFAATSTRSIAETAGVAEATIFRHFASKEDLLLRIVRPLAQRLMAPAVAEAQAVFDAADGDPETMIRGIFRARLAFADRYAPLVRILLQELPVNPALQGLLQEGVMAPLQAFAEARLTREAAEGRMKPIPAARFLRIVASVLIGYWVARSMVAPGDWDDEAEIAVMAAVLTRGLAA